MLAIVAGAYAMYHGPEGLRAIAERLHTNAARVATALESAGYGIAFEHFFDTVVIDAPARADELVAKRLRLVLTFAVSTRTAWVFRSVNLIMTGFWSVW